jgi:hypothetical protein
MLERRFTKPPNGANPYPSSPDPIPAFKLGEAYFGARRLSSRTLF